MVRSTEDTVAPAATPGESWRIPLLLAVGFVAVALWAARDYGLAFDSQLLFPYGDAVLRCLVGAGPWPLVQQAQTFELYGPLALLGAAASSTVLHDRLGLTDALLGHHVFVLLTAGALVGVTARLAADLIDVRVAILAALFLATAPRFFAEAQNNVVDVPATLAWTVALAGIVRAARRARLAPLAATAVASGALGAIRLPNLPFLPCVLLVWLALDGDTRRRLVRACRGRWRVVAALGVLAVASLVLFRPLAWMSPRLEFWALYEALFVPPPGMSRGIVDVFYGGTVRHGGPRSFHLVMLAVTTPLPMLAAAAVGVVVTWWRHRSAAYLLGVWLVVSLGRHAALDLGNYDGIRHVLDVLPALAVLAGAGAAAAIDTVAAERKSTRVAAWVLGTAILIAPGGVAVWRLHPYAVTYYNALVGGVGGASRWFETEYSGAAYREGVAWAVAHLRGGDRVWLTRDYDRSLVLVEASYLRRDVPLWARGLQPPSEDARLFTMQILRPGPVERAVPGVDLAAFPVVHEVRRDGATLLRVREVPVDVLGRLRAEALVTPRRGGAPPGS